MPIYVLKSDNNANLRGNKPLRFFSAFLSAFLSARHPNNSEYFRCQARKQFSHNFKKVDDMGHRGEVVCAPPYNVYIAWMHLQIVY